MEDGFKKKLKKIDKANQAWFKKYVQNVPFLKFCEYVPSSSGTRAQTVISIEDTPMVKSLIPATNNDYLNGYKFQFCKKFTHKDLRGTLMNRIDIKPYYVSLM